MAGGSIELTGDLAHRLARVLRARPGDSIVLFTGDGREHVVSLDSVSATTIAGRVVESRAGLPEPDVRLTLYQSVVKGERFEWVLEKGTELGVARFVPLATGRAVVHSSASSARLARWRRIVIEATEQCGRCVVPEVAAQQSLDDALTTATGHVLLPYEGESVLGLRAAVRTAGEVRDVGVLIGPEGGFSEAEVARAVAVGATAVSLGRRILRSETAGIATVAAVMYELGQLGS